MVVIAKHRALLERLGLATLEQVKAYRGDLVKDHRGRRDVLRITAADAAGEPLVLFLKRNWRPYKKDGLASLLRRGSVCSQSRQEWEHSLALQASGLATAGLVACGEKCGPLWEKFSFILTEAAPGQTLERFLRECQDRTVRRRVCDALALTIRHLHAAGCAMPDLFTRHIFVELRQGAPTFCLIDLARLDRRTALPRRLRARDLAALNITAPLRFVSLRERIRFLRQYAGGLDRSLARQVAARMAHLLKRRKFQDYGQRRGAPDA